MLYKIITYFLALMLIVCTSAAQSDSVLSNKVCKRVVVTSLDFYPVDSVAVIPGTFELRGLDSAYYDFDYNSSILQIKQPIPPGVDYVDICYRRSFFRPTKTYTLVPRAADEGSIIQPNIDISNNRSNKFLSDVIDLGGLQYSGTFGRGVTAGNNQSLAMNSNLNLQFSGYVTDSVKVTAAITDNSIPFQPEGNTQRLQEFDQVFLRFEKDSHQVILGDHEIFRPPGYFLNFYKRVQGIYHQGVWIDNDRYKLKTTEGASVAKGRFNRNTITPKDGNQGPYRLSTSANTLYFVIIANSERVYIDGELLKRGENLDYTIDYNTAEVTFTPRRPINKDLRIIIEFESLDRNYVNPLFVQSTEFNVGPKLKTYLNFYLNQDAATQPINIELSDDDKRLLASIGDSLDLAYVSNYSQVDFDKSKILYRRIDTLHDGVTYNDVFVKNEDPNIPSYLVGFTYTGPLTGNYTLLSDETNGKAYQWVPPLNGIPQGEYSAVQKLTPPQKQQMINLGAEYKLSDNQTVQSEVSFTDNDPNRYSTIDDDKHKGYAVSLDYLAALPLRAEDSTRQTPKLKLRAHAEHLSSAFEPVVRYRNPEFERDWGGTNVAAYQTSQELLTLLSAGYVSEHLNVELRNEFYDKDTSFMGMRNALVASYTHKNWVINTDNSLMTADRSESRQELLRPKISVEKTWEDFAKLKVYSSWFREDNQDRLSSDSLQVSSYSFDVLESGFDVGDEQSIKGGFKFLQRKNRRVEGVEFLDQDLANNFTVNLNVKRLKNQNILFTGTFRDLLTYTPDSAVSQYHTTNSIGRLQYLGTFWDKLISQNLNYEIGTGQEQKTSYFYTEVAAGQGQYYWNDYNGDSVQQLNEFEVALYPDQARYIKIYTPTNDFVNARFLNFNYTLNIDPTFILLNKKSRLAKIVKNLSTLTSVQISNKILDDQTFNIYNPFYTPSEDTTLVHANNTINNVIYYNRNNSNWGLTHTYRTNTSNQILNFGLESRTHSENSLGTRLKLSPSLNWKNEGALLLDKAHTYSEGFSNRNYNLDGYHIKSSLNYNYRTSFRATFELKYKNQDNTSGQEYMRSTSTSLQSRYNISNKSNLHLTMTLDQIAAEVTPNTTIAYVMLSGLQTGTNLLWSVNYSQKIFSNLEMLIEYNGRKPAENKIIHNGTFTMRAVF